MSRSLVVRRLRALAAQGIPPSARFLLPRHGGVVAEVLAEFGSIPLARDAARLDGPPQPTDPDEIVHGLRVLHAAGTKIELQTLLRLGEAALVGAARRLFGSLEAAATAAGVPLATGPMHLRVSRNALARADIPAGRRTRTTPPDTVALAPSPADLEALLRQIDRAARAAGDELERSLQEMIPVLADSVAERTMRGVLEAGEARASAAVARAASDLAESLEMAVAQFANQAAERALQAALEQATEPLRY